MNTSIPHQKPLRICLLIGGFYPLVGGGETHALQLARALMAQGHEVQVLTRRTRSDLPSEDEVQGVPVHRVGPHGYPRWGKYLLLWPAFRWLCRNRSAYDIVYVCALRVLGWSGVAAGLCARKTCVLRSEAHGELTGEYIWNSPGSSPMRRLLMALKPFIFLRNLWYRCADAWVAISEDVREEYRAAGVPDQKILLLPNGIDTDRFKPPEGAEKTALRNRMHVPEGFLFAYSGKLNRGKGLERLLHIWEQFSHKRQHARLVLIGSGGGQMLSCEDELRTFVQDRGLQDRVVFTGYIHGVADYLKACDGYVFLSERETFGLGPLEAMACGLPVISTPCGVLGEIIRDNETGWLAAEGDDEAVVQRLEWMIEHVDEARRIGRAGREVVTRRYGMTAAAERHVEAFAALLKDGTL